MIFLCSNRPWALHQYPQRSSQKVASSRDTMISFSSSAAITGVPCPSKIVRALHALFLAIVPFPKSTGKRSRSSISCQNQTSVGRHPVAGLGLQLAGHGAPMARFVNSLFDCILQTAGQTVVTKSPRGMIGRVRTDFHSSRPLWILFYRLPVLLFSGIMIIRQSAFNDNAGQAPKGVEGEAHRPPSRLSRANLPIAVCLGPHRGASWVYW